MFEQDMLSSFNAFMTVCSIRRNDAARRVMTVMKGKSDPGPSIDGGVATNSPLTEDQAEAIPDLVQMAHDQIVAHIKSRFSGHALTKLVGAVLEAEDWTATISPPGPDGGVDILGGKRVVGTGQPAAMRAGQIAE